MSALDSHNRAAPEQEKGGGRQVLAGHLHLAWRVALVITIGAGLFHLINLVPAGRAGLGPALITPFRAGFIAAWLLLVAEYIIARRRPRLDYVDGAVAALAAVFILRGLLTPETLGITLNWLVTGAGVFYLVKHGIRSARDLRLVVLTLAVAVVIISLATLTEYAFKKNPLFESIQVDAVGIDTRMGGSSQFYRVRSLIGHPGFAGAILVAGAPLVMLAFWRRRLILAASLMLLGVGVFLTFSRGSWILGALFFAPVLIYRGRFWLKRNAKWLAPAVILPALLVTYDYMNREEVHARLGKKPVEEGLVWTKGKDGPYAIASGEADGVIPYNRFLYFDIDDDFYSAGDGPVTVIVHYFDRGSEGIHVEYDSWDETAGDRSGAYALSGYISKTDSHQWTTAAFYLEKPRFEGRQNGGADLRVVDDESLFVVDEVVVQKGKLKLPTVIAQQWESRAGSFGSRVDLYPFAWSVLKENPLGVGLYNTPGTNHHAVDSMPLTWLMEFGWLALPLLGMVLVVASREGYLAFKARGGPAVVLYLSLALLLLHGGHIMIIYDKPSLVMFAAVGAAYASLRPWRHGGALVEAAGRDFML